METESAPEAEIDYLSLSNSYKDQGNDAFQRGDNDNAILYYSQAIDLDPDNHGRSPKCNR